MTKAIVANSADGYDLSDGTNNVEKVMEEKLEKYHFNESEYVPNHPELPALIYRKALNSKNSSLAGDFESCFKENGWSGVWRWGVYDFHHYHSNAHEVLGVASGKATLLLGGPQGDAVKVCMGDVILLPAGTGHKNKDCSPDFEVVGAYPEGQKNKDLIRNDKPLDDTICRRIRKVALPDKDPVFGDDGPLLNEWL